MILVGHGGGCHGEGLAGTKPLLALAGTGHMAPSTDDAPGRAWVLFRCVDGPTSGASCCCLWPRANVLPVAGVPASSAGLSLPAERFTAVCSGAVPDPVWNMRSIEKYLHHTGCIQSADIENFQLGVVVEDALRDVLCCV